MKIPAKIEYACKALLELAAQWPNKMPIQVGLISRNQEIPMKFLTQILLQLKQLGYVNSMRGKTGGYVLNVAPKDLNLKDIFLDLGGENFADSRGFRRNHDIIKDVFDEVNVSFLKTLDNINLENLCSRKKKTEQLSSFEI